MELNIQEFVNTQEMISFSASIAETGREDAGELTWQNAIEYAESHPWTTDTDYIRTYLKDFGAWSESELSDMSLTELNAIITQMIAGDVREERRSGHTIGLIYSDQFGLWYALDC